MTHGRSLALSALVVMVGVGLLAPVQVGAATATDTGLIADYQFQGDRTSVTGAPALTDVGPGNTFATETVDGVNRTVLTFNENDGLDMPEVTGTYGYSIVMLVRLHSVIGYRRLVDFSGAPDTGLYNHDGKLAFRGSAEATKARIKKDRYVQVVITHASSGRKVVGYVDGKKSWTFIDVFQQARTNSSIRFFSESALGGVSASAGAVARIRFYFGALTPTEIAALDREPA